MQDHSRVGGPVRTTGMTLNLHAATAAPGIWLATTSGAFLASFLLYWRTMAPTVYSLDSAELSTAAATGGLVHATGYPLYLLIGRFWSRLPIGDVGFRMNLLSALCGALTIWLVVHLLRRLGVGPWAALCAAGLLATTRYFWAMALVAEVYTLHTALMCAVLLTLLFWADAPSPWRLGVATGVLGLAAGNHASIVLLAPGCLFFVLATEGRQALRARSLLAAAAGLVCGLAIYLYLPYLYAQHPSFNYLAYFDSHGEPLPVDLTSVRGLIWLVSAVPFSDMYFSHGGSSLLGDLAELALELWRNSFVVAFGPALLGIWVGFRRSRAVGGALLLMMLMNAAFFLSYGAPDKETMYLPMYLVWIIWIGLGSQYILSLAYEHAGWVSGSSLSLILAGTVAFSAAWSFPLVDLSDDWSSRERAEAIFDHLEPDALFVGYWHTASVLHYLQMVEGRRPDVQVINRFHIGGRLAALVNNVIDHRPVYMDGEYEDTKNHFRSRASGPVFRIERSEDVEGR